MRRAWGYTSGSWRMLLRRASSWVLLWGALDVSLQVVAMAEPVTCPLPARWCRCLVVPWSPSLGFPLSHSPSSRVLASVPSSTRRSSRPNSGNQQRPLPCSSSCHGCGNTPGDLTDRSWRL